MKIFTFLIILGLALSAKGFVKDPIYDDLEDYDLITSLLRDGKFDLAWDELKLDKMRKMHVGKYQLLLGKYYAGKNEHEKALRHFSQSQNSKDSPVKSEADLYAARSHFFLKHFQTCREIYNRKNIADLLIEADYIQKSHCEYENKHPEMAWITLHKAQLVNDSFAIVRELIQFKIVLGLSHEALTDALQWLHTHPVMASQYMNIAEIFHAQNKSEEALYVLEAGRAREPMNAEMNLILSQMYFQKNLLNASAEGFARAAETDGKYYYHAAELERQLGHSERSQYHNIYIVDPKEKLKQKIASYVDRSQFLLIASLESVIQRSELSKDDEIRYALAYSLVREGQIDQPLKYLAQITKPELIEKTTILRKTLIDCQEKKGSCSL